MVRDIFAATPSPSEATSVASGGFWSWEPDEPRTLTWDLESRPYLAYGYDVWNTNVRRDAVVRKSSVMCFAAKWYENKDVEFWSMPEHGYATMVERAWQLLDEADQVISYNGARYDTKKMNAEFARCGLGEPSPYKELDLFQAVRRRFGFMFKGLDDVAKELGLGHKGKVEDWWATCEQFLLGNPDAIAEVRKYNVQDVLLAEQVFDELKDWL